MCGARKNRACAGACASGKRDADGGQTIKPYASGSDGDSRHTTVTEIHREAEPTVPVESAVKLSRAGVIASVATPWVSE